jgi:uncharacterized protein (DUF302 family)
MMRVKSAAAPPLLRKPGRTARLLCAAWLAAFSLSTPGAVMTTEAEAATAPDAPRANPAALVTLPSPYDFETTVARLKETLAARGLTLFADIDQRDAAARVGMPLRPTRLLLFGNPKGGTPVMAAHPHAALELPLRAVVWQDDAQQVFIDYLDVTKTLPAYGVDAALLAPFAQVPALLRTVVQPQQR